VSRNFCIDRNDIILAFELQTVTTDVDERDRVRPGICGFLQKVAESAAQRVLVKIASTSNIKASCLESLCDQPGIVGRRSKSSGLIASIADKKRNAFFSAGGFWVENERKRDQSNQSNQRRDDRADPWHGIPHWKLATASK